MKAVSNGYRAIDCAEVYGNEKQIGDGIKLAIEQGLCQRGELFITTKIFNNYHLKRAHISIRKSLNDLGLEHVDLLMLHWPYAFTCESLPVPSRDALGNPHPDIVPYYEYNDTWREIENILEAGLCKHIGLCNFTLDQLTDLCNHCRVKPEAIQIEIHPYLYKEQLDIIKYCNDHDITVIAYSSFGSPDSYSGLLSGPILLEDSTVKRIADAHGVTTSQVLLRWSIQHGHVVIPKATSVPHLLENLECSKDSIMLSSEEMNQLDDMYNGTRWGKGWMRGQFL